MYQRVRILDVKPSGARSYGQSETCVITDAETDGPVPEPNSMLCSASAAFRAGKALRGCDTFTPVRIGALYPCVTRSYGADQ